MFDYCFNHFQAHHEAGTLNDLLGGEGLQLSCLHLGFYLASWGMFRGKAALLQRSVRTYGRVIEALINAPDALWTLDCDGYNDENIAAVLAFGRMVRTSFQDGASDILVTKVLLGTMGCVPAFDGNFKRGFGVSTFGPKALHKVGAYYVANASQIDSGREFTLDFATGGPTTRRYTRAKVIDMIFYVEGGGSQ